MRAYALLVAVSAFTIGCGEEDPALARFAPKLSSYPFFDGRLADQKPAAGVVPYEVISTLYADGAGKNRFLAVPPGAKIHFDPTGRWLFPDGTTIIKTFFFDPDERAPGKDRRLVETRLLKYTEGAWYAVTYVWNAAQTDAEREIAGREIHVDRVDGNGAPAPVVYQVPSTSQCKSCHGQAKKFVPLGPRSRQLDRAHDFGAGPENQLDHMAKLGLFDGPIPDEGARTKLVDPAGTAPLVDRARAYLDANCAHCHNQEGFAASTALRLEIETTEALDLGVCRHPVAAGGGSGGFLFDVVPGHPEQSVMIYRMKSSDPKAKMPQLPLTTVDEFGVRLLSDWIASLAGGPCE